MSGPAMPRLVTIPFSHFCEKARWALDLAGLGYDEDAWPPGLHRLPIARYGATTAPVLVVDDGTVLRESGDIVRHADQAAGLGLYGRTAAERAEIDGLMARFDKRLGPSARLGVYAHVLDDREAFTRLGRSGLVGARRAAFDALRPAIGGAIRRHFGIDEDARRRAEEEVEEELALADERRGGGPYLVGDRFSAADLTFAALGAPLVVPPEYGAPLPALDELPAPMRDGVVARRATPSGAAILDLYARHRRAGAATPRHGAAA
jgi:glutathione S-transferase